MFRIHGFCRSARTVLIATAAASVALSISAPAASAGSDDPVSGSTTVAIPPPVVSEFKGLYDVRPGSINTAKECTKYADRDCVLYFITPKPALDCGASAEPVTKAYFSPRAGTPLPATEIALYWVGGGALGGRAPRADAPGVYDTRIQILGVCGHDLMVANLPYADVLLAATQPKFSGYVNSVAL